MDSISKTWTRLVKHGLFIGRCSHANKYVNALYLTIGKRLLVVRMSDTINPKIVNSRKHADCRRIFLRDHSLFMTGGGLAKFN